MDNKTWDAFSYDKHPVISYALSTATISDGSLKATGTLSMAGVSQPVTMDVQYSLLAQCDIRLIGSYSVKMRDYKMNPPTAMMGTIKVGEEVTVKFDVLVTPSSK
jgi:polyisoprenoid-binding protein YceI